MENKISVVINTYNAERHLREVLEAVKGFDEVLVCDMESTDGTRAIAEEYGCRVVTFPKAGCKSAEPARTFAIQQAAHGWVLVVDADELITPKLREYLYGRIRRGDCPAGLYIPRHNRFMGRYSRGWAHDYQLRFFVREGTVWPPFVHTFPTVQGRTERIPARCKMIHLADESMRQWVAKMNEYTDNEIVRKTCGGGEKAIWHAGIVLASAVAFLPRLHHAGRFPQWPPRAYKRRTGRSVPVDYGGQNNRKEYKRQTIATL